MAWLRAKQNSLTFVHRSFILPLNALPQRYLWSFIFSKSWLDDDFCCSYFLFNWWTLLLCSHCWYYLKPSSWLTRRRMPRKISIPMVSSQPQMIEVFTCQVQSLYYYYKIHLCFWTRKNERTFQAYLQHLNGFRHFSPVDHCLMIPVVRIWNLL